MHSSYEFIDLEDFLFQYHTNLALCGSLLFYLLLPRVTLEQKKLHKQRHLRRDNHIYVYIHYFKYPPLLLIE